MSNDIYIEAMLRKRDLLQNLETIYNKKHYQSESGYSKFLYADELRLDDFEELYLNEFMQLEILEGTFQIPWKDVKRIIKKNKRTIQFLERTLLDYIFEISNETNSFKATLMKYDHEILEKITFRNKNRYFLSKDFITYLYNKEKELLDNVNMTNLDKDIVEILDTEIMEYMIKKDYQELYERIIYDNGFLGNKLFLLSEYTFEYLPLYLKSGGKLENVYDSLHEITIDLSETENQEILTEEIVRIFKEGDIEKSARLFKTFQKSLLSAIFLRNVNDNKNIQNITRAIKPLLERDEDNLLEKTLHLFDEEYKKEISSYSFIKKTFLMKIRDFIGTAIPYDSLPIETSNEFTVASKNHVGINIPIETFKNALLSSDIGSFFYSIISIDMKQKKTEELVPEIMEKNFIFFKDMWFSHKNLRSGTELKLFNNLTSIDMFNVLKKGQLALDYRPSDMELFKENSSLNTLDKENILEMYKSLFEKTKEKYELDKKIAKHYKNFTNNDTFDEDSFDYLESESLNLKVSMDILLGKIKGYV